MLALATDALSRREPPLPAAWPWARDASRDHRGLHCRGSLAPRARADSASCARRFGAAGVKGAKRVAQTTVSAAAASRRSALRPGHAARGARLMCAAGGAVGATDVKNAFELLQKGCVRCP